MVPNWQKKIGRWGEEQAKSYLCGQGFQIIECNAYTPHGELDIVARRLAQIHFVEVKTRTNHLLGYPESSITSKKRCSLANSAAFYIQQHPDLGDDWHIDVIAVSGRPGCIAPQILFFENAVE